MQIVELLNSYPRQRPPLSERLRKVYEAEYLKNRNGTTLATSVSRRLESWMHRQVASNAQGHRLLELGGGTLNHLPYEYGDAQLQYEVIEPFESLFRQSPYVDRVSQIYHDISDIEPHHRYDRIVSVAVLEHLTDLPAVVSRCGLLLKPDGLFQHGIPSEGGWLWGLGWRLTTGLAFRLRTGLDYRELMQHEHVNRALEILAIVDHFFEATTVRRFPLPTHHLSFYVYLEARGPRRDRCEAYLSGRGNRA